jgi:serine/threonine protein kinase
VPDGEDWESSGRLIEAGEVLSKRYEVISLIGSGGMGVVYKVKQPHFSKYFALKTVRSPYLSEQTISRFRKEAKAASALNHPGLITVYDFGLLEDGQPFMVMDLVESGSLADAIKRYGRLSIDSVLDIFVKASDALQHAHQNKIIHRDLKPGNILLDEPLRRVRIADFGVAKILEDDSGASLRLTQTGEIVGSPLYMSPEQCAGKMADERSDIYSLGCAMFEALTGRPPFMGESALATLLLHQKQVPLSLAEAVPGEHFPERLEEACSKSLAKDPAHRYQSMREFQQALLAVHAPPSSADRKKPDKLSQTNSLAALQTIVPLPVVTVMILIAMVVSSFVTALVVRSSPPAFNSQASVGEDRPATQEGGVVVAGRWNPPTNESDRTSKIGGKRIFHFDERGSMGCLSDCNPLNKAKREAIGTVAIPEDVLLKYRPNWAVCEMPYVFDRFGPDDLYAVDFGSLPITDPVLEHISRLSGLRKINLNYTDVTDKGLRNILDLPHLEELSLANTDVTSSGIASLSRVKTLKNLVIHSTLIDAKALDYLRQATQLDRLTIKKAGLKDPDLEALSGLKRLTTLSLDQNMQISTEGLKYLTGLGDLRLLYITDCDIHSGALQYLKQMTSLNEVYVRKGQLTSGELAAIEKELPNLRIIQVERGHRKLSLDDGNE